MKRLTVEERDILIERFVKHLNDIEGQYAPLEVFLLEGIQFALERVEKEVIK